MEQVTTILKVVFIIITALTIFQFYVASNKSKTFLLVAVSIATIQFLIGRTNFYENENTTPPRFLLLVAPAIIIIMILFASKQGRHFLNSLDTKKLTLLHTIRIPVEVVLYYLFVAKTIPQVMTFEGRNFDILAGLTAPIIFYFGYIKNKISNKILLVWNMLSLALLINIIFISIFSSNTAFQKLGFEQSNIAIRHFPFNWLPSIVVPIVLLSHLATIKQLIIRKKKSNS
jgi:hypothetical protein